MELQPVVSHLLKLSSAWNPFSVEKKKKQPKNKKTKNPNRKKLVKVVCMSEHWPEVGQVCFALGMAQMKAGALWGRCPGQVLSEAVPDPAARGSASTQGTTASHFWAGHRPAGAAGLCCCSLEGAVPLSGVLHCSGGAPVLSPGFAPRLVNYTEECGSRGRKFL